MSNRRTITPGDIAVVVAALGILYGGLCCWCYCGSRALFVNKFGFSERMGMVPTWRSTPRQVKDRAGNIFLADYRLNVLLVIQLPTREVPVLASADTRTVQIRLPGDETIQVDVGRNSVIEVFHDRTVSTHTLQPGRAKELFEALERSTLSDRTSLITD